MSANRAEDWPNPARGITLETVNCSFCGSSDYSPYDAVDEWRIVRCVRCDFCFTNPRPIVESLPSFYDESYFRDHEVIRFGCLNEVERFDYRQRIADIESRQSKRGRLLEVGAAEGGFLSVMRKRGWDVSGVELSRAAVEAAKKNEALDIFCGSLAEFDPAASYDVICMYHSLEHIPDPVSVIERAYSVLVPGGIIVIEVPNLNGFDARFNQRRKLLSYDLPRHLNHFTPAVLSKKLKQTGFKILDVDLYYPDFILRLAAMRGARRSTNTVLVEARETTTAANIKGLPMAVRDSNWKTRLLKSVSWLLPGWRFTLAARK